MPFELTNASTFFQSFINDVLRLFLDRFCSAYLDDVLVYSSTLSEHQQHVQQIIEALAINELHLNLKKCKFHQQEVAYLDFIVSHQSIKMNSAKVQVIARWESCTNLHDVR